MRLVTTYSIPQMSLLPILSLGYERAGQDIRSVVMETEPWNGLGQYEEVCGQATLVWDICWTMTWELVINNS